ncbi:hypothetical protein SDRG_08896 [Saprolegnia diclina VS20]|uniref:Uncharacterized protein n=1 Tax=Saprolegnia diclina (strain VS20) TaxID=1156394 RepID=T0RLY5_SAPDV|nr:hypothetical protein SDRG_08896 [Saprolegnia diclina VS20]EQC33378.1 hypothetical protein SDRG_08896 [Saprolegnia diclina VS20]|eukprot:XP_008613018.1 hypothetical protein SDRG_08896 [Saprolegnia diclina VS20]
MFVELGLFFARQVKARHEASAGCTHGLCTKPSVVSPVVSVAFRISMAKRRGLLLLLWLLACVGGAELVVVQGPATDGRSPPPCVQASLRVAQAVSLDELQHATPNVSHALVAFLAQSDVKTSVRLRRVDVTAPSLNAKGNVVLDVCFQLPTDANRSSLLTGLGASIVWTGLRTSLSTLHRRFQLLDQATPLQLVAAPVLRGEAKPSGPTSAGYVQWYLVLRGATLGFWHRMALVHAVAQLLNVSTTSVFAPTAVQAPYDVYNGIATIVPVAIVGVTPSTFDVVTSALTRPLQTLLAASPWRLSLLTQTPDSNGDSALPQTAAAWPAYPQLNPTAAYPLSSISSPPPSAYIVAYGIADPVTLSTLSPVIDGFLSVLQPSLNASFAVFADLTLTTLPPDASAMLSTSLGNSINFVVAGDAATILANAEALQAALDGYAITLTPLPSLGKREWYPYLQLDCPYTLAPLAATIQRIAIAAFFARPLESVRVVATSATTTTFELALTHTFELRYVVSQLEATTAWSTVMAQYGAEPARCSLGAQSLSYLALYPSSTIAWSAAAPAPTTTCRATLATACDQCQRYYDATCYGRPVCYQANAAWMTQLQTQIATGVTDATALFQQPSGPSSDTALAKYYACLAAFACPVHGAQLRASSDETHSLWVSNSTTDFSTLLAYPFGVFNVSTSSLFSTPGALATALTVHAPTVYVNVTTAVSTSGTQVTVTFSPLMRLPLALPVVVSSSAPATITRMSMATQLLVLDPTSSSDSAVVLETPLCVGCAAACRSLDSCAPLLTCKEAVFASAVAQLSTQPVFASIDVTDAVTACVDTASSADTTLFLAAMHCFLHHACPIVTTYSDIVQGRMLALRSVVGVQSLSVVNATTRTLTVDRPTSTSLTIAPSNASDVLSTFFAPIADVTISSMDDATLFITFANYATRHLPTLSVTASSVLQPPRLLVYVAPLNTTRFGFPYQAFESPNVPVSAAATPNRTCVALQRPIDGCIGSCPLLLRQVASAIALATEAMTWQPPGSTLSLPLDWQGVLTTAVAIDARGVRSYLATMNARDVAGCPVTARVDLGLQMTLLSSPLVLSVTIPSPNDNVSLSVFVGGLPVGTIAPASAAPAQLPGLLAGLATASAIVLSSSFNALVLQLSLGSFYGPSLELQTSNGAGVSVEVVRVPAHALAIAAIDPSAFVPH